MSDPGSMKYVDVRALRFLYKVLEEMEGYEIMDACRIIMLDPDFTSSDHITLKEYQDHILSTVHDFCGTLIYEKIVKMVAEFE